MYLRRHARNVLGARNRSSPRRARTTEQLSGRLGVVHGANVVDGADLDDLGSAKSRALAVQGGAAGAAKVRGDLVARVGLLGERLGTGRSKTLAGHDVVDGAGAARDLLAVLAVAQGLTNVSLCHVAAAVLRTNPSWPAQQSS